MYAQFLCTTVANPSATLNRYTGIEGAAAFNATESAVYQVIPHDLTLDRLHIALATAPGAGNSWDFTIVKNGTPTGLTVNITGTATSNKDDTNSVSFAAGDTVSLLLVPTSSPTLPTGFAMSTRQQAQGRFAILGGSTTAITASTFFAPSRDNASTTESAVYAPMPSGCTIDRLYALCTPAPGAGTSWAITVRTASADSAVTCTIADTATANNDTAHSATFAAGDQLAIRPVATGVVASSRIAASVSVRPDNADEAFFLQSHSNTVSTTPTFTQAVGSGATVPATETFGQPVAVVDALTVKALYVRLTTNPGVGKSYTITARKGGVDTAATVTLTNVLGGTASGFSVAYATDNQLCLGIVQVSAPAASRVQTGVAYTMGAQSPVFRNPHPTLIRR